MSHFYGTVQGNRGDATRGGSRDSGIRTVAASWRGCIEVLVYVDENGRDAFVVREGVWHGEGLTREIARGIIGESVPEEKG